MAGVILTVTVRQVDFLDLIDTLVHTVMSTLRKQKIWYVIPCTSAAGMLANHVRRAEFIDAYIGYNHPAVIGLVGA